MGFLGRLNSLRAQCRQGQSVVVLGPRGFPDVQGGVETHAENLYPLVVEAGIQVICTTRSGFHDRDIVEWNGVQLLRMWAPRSRFLEAIVHSIIAIFCTAWIRPDVVHIHAIGPALVTPLARLLGFPVVVTHHGPDYDREKWNSVIARAMLRAGEWAGMRLSNERIVISPLIEEWVRERHHRTSHLIPNGVPIPEFDAPAAILDSFGLEPEKYVLLVSRFIPEKRHLDLMDALEQVEIPGIKLALVGGADHPDQYEQQVLERAASNRNIVLTGVLQGEALKALYQHAAVFVLPSSHEGLPISMLEALSFGLRTLASNIPANLGVGLSEEHYFPLGDTGALASSLNTMLEMEWSSANRNEIRAWVSERFNWHDIAESTTAVFRKAGGLAEPD